MTHTALNIADIPSQAPYAPGSVAGLFNDKALLTALAKRVERFELHKSERVLNNVLRGHSILDVTVH